jgi:RNA polymerase sigma-70 factor, ECF subfamily
MTKEFALTRIESRTEDSGLLEGCREGSLPAFERLYEMHGGRMKSIAMNLLGNAADAEDAVQETFLKVYRAASGFRAGSSLSTWMHRILVNTCYDLMRKGRRRPESPLPEEVPPSPGSATDHPLRLAIEKSVSRLDPRERTAFLLCEVEGFSHREAGEILGVTEGTSRTLLFRAKRRLQKELREGGAFSSPEAS